MNENMDSIEFLIDFVSSLKTIGVTEINYEALSIFFNNNEYKIKEYPGVDLTYLERDLSTLEALNILKKRIFKNKYKINIDEVTSYKVLTNSKEEDLITILRYASSYKVFQHVMTDKSEVTLACVISNINDKFVKEEYRDVIKLVKELKGDKN